MKFEGSCKVTKNTANSRVMLVNASDCLCLGFDVSLEKFVANS